MSADGLGFVDEAYLDLDYSVGVTSEEPTISRAVFDVFGDNGNAKYGQVILEKGKASVYVGKGGNLLNGLSLILNDNSVVSVDYKGRSDLELNIEKPERGGNDAYDPFDLGSDENYVVLKGGESFKLNDEFGLDEIVHDPHGFTHTEETLSGFDLYTFANWLKSTNVLSLYDGKNIRYLKLNPGLSDINDENNAEPWYLDVYEMSK